jgi:hypothetical protein
MQVVGFLKSKLKSSNLFGLNTDCVGFSPTSENNGGEHNIKVGAVLTHQASLLG